MNKAKTNNSFLHDKVALRVAFLPDKPEVTVLDCYHGRGSIWNNVRRNTDKRIAVHGIDIQDYGVESIALIGDNLKIFDSLDLSRYDVVDLDAWGIPAAQFTAVWQRLRPGTIVFYTFIQNMLGLLGSSMLGQLGYTASMVARCPTLFAKNGHEKFIRFLSLHNLSTVIYCRHGRKYYGVVKKE
jgi:hypothetical protein